MINHSELWKKPVGGFTQLSGELASKIAMEDDVHEVTEKVAIDNIYVDNGTSS